MSEHVVELKMRSLTERLGAFPERDLIVASVNAVLSIAESLPCGECGGSGEGPPHYGIVDAETDSCEACHGTGHPVPATVAARLPRLVEAVVGLDSWGIGPIREALSALAKPE